MWSNKWSHNTPLVAETLAVLDLVEIVVSNIKYVEEGRIKVHMDCKKVWELLTVDSLKSSQHVGDGGAIISKMIALEKKRQK